MCGPVAIKSPEELIHSHRWDLVLPGGMPFQATIVEIYPHPGSPLRGDPGHSCPLPPYTSSFFLLPFLSWQDVPWVKVLAAKADVLTYFQSSHSGRMRFVLWISHMGTQTTGIQNKNPFGSVGMPEAEACL